MNLTNLNQPFEHITRQERLKILGYENRVLWFTGLSGSGKSTLGRGIENKLHQHGKLNYVLDGDELRAGINKDLNFSEKSRIENLRRVGEISKILYNSGLFVIACFISPYKKIRENVRSLIGKDFIEIFVKCNLSECEKRDPKGLYRKARAGKIKDFTGISAPYEEPVNPELIVDTKELNIDESVNLIVKFLNENK